MTVFPILQPTLYPVIFEDPDFLLTYSKEKELLLVSLMLISSLNQSTESTGKIS